MLDGMSTNGLFKLIIEEWDVFRYVFKDYSIEKFTDITSHLNVTRCYYNHSNEDYLTEEAQILTKEYINELLEVVSM